MKILSQPICIDFFWSYLGLKLDFELSFGLALNEKYFSENVRNGNYHYMLPCELLYFCLLFEGKLFYQRKRSFVYV